MQANQRTRNPPEPAPIYWWDRELPPLEPLSCRWGFHRYTRWGQKFSIPNARAAFEYQQRTCVRCGKISERRI